MDEISGWGSDEFDTVLMGECGSGSNARDGVLLFGDGSEWPVFYVIDDVFNAWRKACVKSVL